MAGNVELPLDVWNQILSYSELSKQSHVRKVSKVVSKASIKFEECCVEPSSWEIVNLLSMLLRLYDMKLFNYINFPSDPWISSYKITLIDKELKPASKKQIFVSRYYMYGIWRGKEYQLSTRQQLTNFIGNFKLKLNKSFTYKFHGHSQPNNWLFLRNILRLRTNCTSHGWNSDLCYISFISKYKSNVFSKYRLNGQKFNIIIDGDLPLNKLDYILNKNAIQRLVQDLHTFYGLGEHKYGARRSVTLDLDGLNELSNWLKQWLLTNIMPDDLIDNLLYTEIYTRDVLPLPVYTYKTLLNPLQQLVYMLRDI